MDKLEKLKSLIKKIEKQGPGMSKEKQEYLETSMSMNKRLTTDMNQKRRINGMIKEIVDNMPDLSNE